MDDVTLRLVNIVEEGNLWQGHTHRDVYKDEWKVERETAASLKKGQIELQRRRADIVGKWGEDIMKRIEGLSDYKKTAFYNAV